MTNQILLKFAKKGINLSPDAYAKVMESDNPTSLASELIVKLKSSNFKPVDLISVNGKTIDEITGNISSSGGELEKKDNTPKADKISAIEPDSESKDDSNIENKDTPKPKVDPENDKKDESLEGIVKKEDSEKIEDTKIQFKRNLEKIDVEYDFEVIQDSSNKSYTSGEIGDLITYFQSRYEKLSNILKQRPDLKMTTKVADIEDGQNVLNLILMVKEIRSTKNGHKFIEFEDDTGSISILFSNKNDELFAEAEKLVRDEVVGVIANKDGDFVIANQLIYPGVTRIEEKEMDFGIVFLSDVHIGSLTFLEDAFQKFIDWINCEYGNEEQRKVAEDIKYLIVAGDIVDGIGVYPNQDKELSIKDIRKQYDEAARFLGNIRSDIKIIITPGNHDASRLAEPQPAVPEEYAESLYKLNNVEFVSNPSVVSLDGINVLIYHGESFNELPMAIKGLSYEKNEQMMEELLRKRHLAPIYGERTPLASELEDYLVIEHVPDIFHTGHIHINSYKKYNGIHLINSGTFQTQTEYQKIKNIEPTPAQVPVIHKGQYKLFRFID
jgi:DNA polymerase II small subunit